MRAVDWADDVYAAMNPPKLAVGNPRLHLPIRHAQAPELTACDDPVLASRQRPDLAASFISCTHTVG